MIAPKRNHGVSCENPLKAVSKLTAPVAQYRKHPANPVIAWSMGEKIQNKTIQTVIASALLAAGDICKGRNTTLTETAIHKRAVISVLIFVVMQCRGAANTGEPEAAGSAIQQP